jgi:3'(2'), 5'-bisphosphate nucleotidase
MTNAQPPGALLQLAAIALLAGREIMAVYASDFATRTKGDLTPVTEADEAAEKVILAELAKHDATTPVISEEAASTGRIPAVAGRFYLVDPLDGTKEFISRNGEFTVNIGLIENGEPVSGIVYAPALERLFLGRVGAGAWQGTAGPDTPADTIAWTAIHTRQAPPRGLTVVASRSHRDARTEEWLKQCDVKDFKPAGSSLKFCLVAAGEADLYPRFGPTMEWDTAAGHAVLAAAGGTVSREDGAPLRYGKQGEHFRNPAFIARAA